MKTTTSGYLVAGSQSDSYRMDTVDKFLCGLSPGELEKLKQKLVRCLVEKKVLEKCPLLARQGSIGTAL